MRSDKERSEPVGEILLDSEGCIGWRGAGVACSGFNGFRQVLALLALLMVKSMSVCRPMPCVAP